MDKGVSGELGSKSVESEIFLSLIANMHEKRSDIWPLLF